MDFDKFIEKDIIEFLDNQSMKEAQQAAGAREEEFDLYEITQDYTQSMQKALEKDDLKKATKIFEEVKNKYLHSPEGSLSRKRLYIILEELYEKLKDFESEDLSKKSLFDNIKEYEKQGLFSGKTPEEPSEKDKQSSEEYRKAKQKYSELDKKLSHVENELKKIIAQAKENQAGPELEKAIKKYREMKSLVKEIPDLLGKEKSTAYESALGWYYTIRKLKEKKGESIHEAASEKELEKNLTEIRELKHEIVASHQRIRIYLEKQDLERAIKEYKHLKSLCERFPNRLKEEKTALLSSSLALYQSIKKLERKLLSDKKSEHKEKELDEKHDQKKQAIKADARQQLEKVREKLRQKKSAEAIEEYRKLKHIFNQYPDDNPDEKNHLYKEIIGSHKDIRMLEEDLKKKKMPLHLSGKEKSSEINKGIEEAHKLLDRGKTKSASELILQAKHKTQMLPKEAFDEKYRLIKEIEKLEHKLLYTNNINRMGPDKEQVIA